MTSQKITEDQILHDPFNGLEGKFFFLTSEGRTACRQVGAGFIPRHTTNNPNGAGAKFIAAGRKVYQWRDDQITFIEANLETLKPTEMARALEIPYDILYAKFTKIRSMKRTQQ